MIIKIVDILIFFEPYKSLRNKCCHFERVLNEPISFNISRKVKNKIDIISLSDRIDFYFENNIKIITLIKKKFIN